MECKHFHYKDIKKNACDAFPRGIPQKILYEGWDHTKPYTGDKGIRFEKK
jgi:hypothetical protein